MNFKKLLLPISASLIAVIIWESLKFLLNKIIEYSNMEHAGITNVWFILFFISVNLLFFLLHLKYSKSDYSKAQKDKSIAEKEVLPQKSKEYDILDDCVLESPGWYRNPITDVIFCFKCWHHPNKSKIPIIKNGIGLSAWICPKCKEPYRSIERTLKKLFFKQSYASMIRQRPSK